jgi:hypothetical protein
MSDDPLIKRVDSLIRREPTVGAKGDVPVLTDVVSGEPTARGAVDDAALEALARALERAVLERMAPELERIVGEALAGARSELKDSVTQMVREAVAASVAFALRPKKPE